MTERAELGKVKGSNIRPMIEWFAVTRGEGELFEIAEALPPEYKREIMLDSPSLGVLPAGWYTEMLASVLAETFVERAGVGEAPALRRIGEVIIDRSLGRISRAAIEWFGSPEMVAKSSEMFWRMYHDTGIVSARIDDHTIFAECREWTDHSLMWCKVVGQSCRHTLSLTGCKDARVLGHSCGGGTKPCSMVFKWD